MRMPDSMSENICQTSATWWGSLEESHLFRRLSKIDTLWDPARIIAIINNGNDIKHLILDSLFHFWLRFGCGDAFCTDTFLKKNRRDAQKPGHRAAFTHRGFYAKKEVFTHRCFVQRCFARINKGT